jgi:hypothetical protein
MQKFTTKIVDMMKAEKLFQTQGGPIILSQARKCNLNIIYFNFVLLISASHIIIFYIARKF